MKGSKVIGAASLFLAMSSILVLTTAAENFYPIQTRPPLMVPFSKTTQNSIAVRNGATGNAFAATYTIEERFFICPVCPPPLRNTVYSPRPTHRGGSTTVLAQGDSNIPDMQCPDDDKPLLVAADGTEYYICCPTEMAQGTEWFSDRGLQCCNDYWHTSCKHDPTDAQGCGVGYLLTTDAISGKTVCKETKSTKSFPTSGSASTSSSASPSILLATTSIYSLSAMHTTTATSITNSNGCARLRQCENSAVFVKVAFTVILLIVVMLL